MAGLLPKTYTNANLQEQQQLWHDYSTVYVSNMQYAADLFHQASTKQETVFTRMLLTMSLE